MRRELLMVVTTCVLASQARSQSTAFSYQGELKLGGLPANGTFDMRFRVYDAPVGGSQPGPTVCVDNVAVSDGKFLASVDVGPLFTSTAPRYLEIEVRTDTGQSCANTTGYTLLSPRQLLASAPRASAATTANSLTIPNGSSVLVNLTNTGNVGIGTGAPTSQLHLNGVQDAVKITATAPKIDLLDTSAANARFQLQNAGGRFFMTSEAFINGTNTGGFAMVDTQGRLGLGVFDPGAPLDVAGRVVFRGNSGQFNSAGAYLASPLSSPVIRGFVGLLDDTHIGFWGATVGWGFTMDTVSGAVRTGTSGQYYVPAGDENLRIIRGSFNADLSISHGTGYTVLHTGTGFYQVTFDTPFPSQPTITLTPHENNISAFDNPVAGLAGATTSGFLAHIRISGTVTADRALDFIAIGPR